MVVLTRCFIDGINGLSEVLEVCQELVKGHSVFVIEIGGRKVFPEFVVDKSVLMGIEVSNLQDSFDFVLPRVEHAE